MTDQRVRLRELLAEGRYLIAPGAYDTLTARLVELNGFSVVYLTGGGFSRSNGFPDIGLLSLAEILPWLGRTVDALSIPVIADADAGHGNAANVVRTVREFEKTGIAAFHLEDQLTPKKCGHYEGKQIVSQAEMVGKIRAAVDTRRDANLIIIARTDARASEGLEAAIDRMNAYLEAGADLGFVEAPQSKAELEAIPPRLTKPSVANVFEGGKTPALCAIELESLGYRLGLYPSQTHRAAISAANEVLAALKRDGHTNAVEQRMITFSQREAAVNAEYWRGIEQRYMENI
jgi:2-methylisocitrate lyase-like PEP mutase family enzyme